MNETGGAESPDAAFARHLSTGEIHLQICDECGRQVFPPRVLCPRCGAGALTWKGVDGGATVYSTTVVRQRADRGGDYNVAVIELVEGARMLSRVSGIAPQSVVIGDRVRAYVETIGEQRVVAFAPDGGVGE